LTGGKFKVNGNGHGEILHFVQNDRGGQFKVESSKWQRGRQRSKDIMITG
jgi:hypothetical protein